MSAPAAEPVAPRALLAGLVRKQQIVAEVIRGRVTLLEAAERFRTAGGEPVTGSEAACRSVIGWVDLALRDRPERAEIVVERLERELQSQLGRSRTLSMPG